MLNLETKKEMKKHRNNKIYVYNAEFFKGRFEELYATHIRVCKNVAKAKDCIVEEIKEQLKSGKLNVYNESSIDGSPRILQTEITDLDDLTIEKKVRDFVDETFTDTEYHFCCDYYITSTDLNDFEPFINIDVTIKELEE